MYAVVSALNDCQEKMGTGYLSAFPSEYFDRFEAIKTVWAPYYTIHKVDVLPESILASYRHLCSALLNWTSTDIGRSFGSAYFSRQS